MIEPVDGLFTAIILIPGFFCIFIPHKIIGLKVRLSSLELTILSLVVSLTIFLLTSISYLLLYPILFNTTLDLAAISSSKLISDYLFLGLCITYTLILFLVGVYSINQDIFRHFRKLFTGIDTIIAPEKYVWDIALKEHKGHVIIETTNDEYFLGVIDWYTLDSKEKEILLKNPEYLDIKNHTSTSIDERMWYDIDKMLFLTNDIRRIYLIPKNKNVNVD